MVDFTTTPNAAQTRQFVEQHIIRKNDPRWSKIDAASFLSKNLYNATLYTLRQHFFATGQTIGYKALASQMKANPDYCALPRKVSQWVLKQVSADWASFWAAHRVWKRCPEKFSGKPNLPHYKAKLTGRNLLTYTVQAVSKEVFKQQGIIQPSQLDITIQTQQKSFDQVRIVPHKTHYVVEVVFTVEVKPEKLDPTRVAAIDLGVDNLATVTFNQPGYRPLLVNGKPLKAINQFYNKERARLQSLLKDTQKSSRRLDALTDKRNRRIHQYLHLTSRRLIETLCLFNIGTLIIGKNDGWKQEVEMGARNNQNFVQIPHSRLINLVMYKAQLAGIEVILTEESYTSKCSFLDLEPIGKHEVYAGKRVKRWLFVARDGRAIHADVNGSYNIMRKVIPNALAGGIAASVVKPVRVTPH